MELSDKEKLLEDQLKAEYICGVNTNYILSKPEIPRLRIF